MAQIKLSEAAALTGKSEKTLYRHASQGRLSTTLNEEGQKTVDTSELQRVYGSLRGTESQTLKSSPLNENAFLEQKIHFLERENDFLRSDIERIRENETKFIAWQGNTQKSSFFDNFFFGFLFAMAIFIVILVLIAAWIKGYRLWFLL